MKGEDTGGAVYVYINNAGVWEGNTPVRLIGTKDSMFGVAVENIGDINQDSYKGDQADLFALCLYCLCHLQSHKLCFFLIQTLRLELRRKILGQEKSTFITALHRGSKRPLHRWIFV